MRHAVTLVGPDGVEIDISDRLLGGVGSITQQLEEDFLELVHGDVQLEIDDWDDAIQQHFAGVNPTDVYEVLIDRHVGMRRPRWRRLFRGILDLPWSLRFDLVEQTVSIQAFSFSKLLEASSAESVARAFENRTLQFLEVAGSTTIILTPDVGLLEPGDTIELDDDTDSEELVALLQ